MSNKHVYRTDLQGLLEDLKNVDVNCCPPLVQETQMPAAELDLPVTSAQEQIRKMPFERRQWGVLKLLGSPLKLSGGIYKKTKIMKSKTLSSVCLQKDESDLGAKKCDSSFHSNHVTSSRYRTWLRAYSSLTLMMKLMFQHPSGKGKYIWGSVLVVWAALFSFSVEISSLHPALLG